MTESKDLKNRRRRRSKKQIWKLSAPQGGALANVAPVFSDDHRFLVVLHALEIRLYAFPARQCVVRVPIVGASMAVDLYVDSSAELTSEGFPKVWVAMRNGVCISVDWKSESSKSINLNGLGVQRIHKILGVVDQAQTFVLAVSDGVHDSDISIVRVSADGSSPPSTLLQVNKASLISLSHSKSHFILGSSQLSKHYKKAGSGSVEVLTVGKFGNPTSFETVVSTTIERARSSSTIAVSDSGVVAVGSMTGVIDLYYPVTDAESTNERRLEYRQSSKAHVIRTLKWHLDPVRALSFSLDGNYLISGGNEKVLLFWQLDTGNIQFLPRLPGPITNIVVDNTSTTYALSLGNNNEDIVLLAATDLDARLRVSSINASYNDIPPLSLARANISSKEPQSSASLKLLNLSEEAKRAKGFISNILDSAEISLPNFSIFPSAIHQFTPHAQQQSLKPHLYWYFPTITDAQIQIYDPLRGEQVAVQSVARTLQLGKVLFEEAIPDPTITQLCLSADSQWMATVDETTTQPIDDLLSKSDVQINLKFWAEDSASNEGAVGWKLVSQITSPHGSDVPVAAVVAAPQAYHRGHAFITACHGRGLRLWRPRIPQVRSRQVEWSARHIIDPSYEFSISKSSLDFSADSVRELPDVSLAWASDASIVLLGTGFDIYVVAVPTEKSGGSFEAVRCFSGIIGSPVRGLGLIGTSIIVLSERQLTVYDILRDDIAWSANIGYTPKGCKALIAFGESSFAVAINYASKAKSGLALLSNVYLFSHKSPIPLHVAQHSRPIAAVHSIPSVSKQKFTFIDTDKTIYTLSGPDAATGAEPLKDADVGDKAPAAEAEITVDVVPDAGSTAILNPKSGKFTIPAKESTTETTTIPEGSAQPDVVLKTTIVDTVFAGPEYAVGDLDGVFDKLLEVIGQKEE
ncbi:hypothetical protein POJ06DRAFT_246177 [Lipomyces tetrasporus]|uniref:WD40 repeat-like protein n=1 Tax=Lipomyces tetrasporus TaxID=54092 RepID=A0AAD7QXA8_9ASCO|nr:uncharacterized protein POJ06DRAFT_246177 [Lipomyces tetrasporus]KAJ8102961.1 hypothetical protein POJ06DRAFT_246177 [Lipomyces tetrasporus]